LTLIVTWRAQDFTRLTQRVTIFTNAGWKQQAYHRLVDAGRKTKTRVQRAAAQQMALKSGNYQSYVVANTRGIGNKGSLSFRITASAKGSDVEIYKGLRVLKSGGQAAKAMNAGRSLSDAGFVKSGVWNAPRTFKRSFESNGGLFSLIPGNGSARLPKAFWTFGKKEGQPRDGEGKFAKSGRQGFRVRRLYGPALGKELSKDQALTTFMTFGPKELETQMNKLLRKLI